MSEERRHFTRVDIEYPIVLQPMGGGEIHGVVSNLSLKGLLVRPEWDLASGEEVAFSFPNPSGASGFVIEGRAVVVRRAGEEEIGLRLTEIDIEGLSHLRRLVELNLGDSERALEETARWMVPE